MQGYILFRRPDGRLDDTEAIHRTRKGLIEALEKNIEPSTTVLGIVLGPEEDRALKLVA